MSDCANPYTAAHQAPPTLGFSRQEHWSGLPFPSPMHKSEKGKVKVKSFSHVRLLATPWTMAHQGPPSMGFSRQEYWTGVPLPSPILLTRPQQYVISSSLETYFGRPKREGRTDSLEKTLTLGKSEGRGRRG